MAVPRTLDPALHSVRKDVFLDVAERLITTRGYEGMSIQDVLDGAEASRGAFYHYFASKQALLDAVLERFVERAVASVQPALAEPGLRGLPRLRRLVGGLASFKTENKRFLEAVLQVWTSDANVLVRDKLRRFSKAWLGPILSRTLREATEDGELTVCHPEETTEVLLHLVQGYQELAADQFLARQRGELEYEACLRSYRAFQEATERVLGAEPGSLAFTDEPTLRLWFG